MAISLYRHFHDPTIPSFHVLLQPLNFRKRRDGPGDLEAELIRLNQEIEAIHRQLNHTRQKSNKPTEIQLHKPYPLIKGYGKRTSTIWGKRFKIDHPPNTTETSNFQSSSFPNHQHFLHLGKILDSQKISEIKNEKIIKHIGYTKWNTLPERDPQIRTNNHCTEFNQTEKRRKKQTNKSKRKSSHLPEVLIPVQK